MNPALALAAGLLVLLSIVAIGLIPVLDAELRRANARRVAAEARHRGAHPE